MPRIVNTPGSKCATIVIPHFHPGSYVRNPTMASQDKLFWYPWVATWAFLDTAISLLSQDKTLRGSRQSLLARLKSETYTTLGQAEYFESLRTAKAEFAAAKGVDTLAILTCKQSSHMESTVISQASNEFATSDDREKVLNLHLMYVVTPGVDIQFDATTETVGSKKRSRDHFETDLYREQDSRAGLKSSNWGPTDKTLARWRKVHNFIQKPNCLQSVPKLKDKVGMYRKFFAVAASVHRYTGGLIVGETPLHAAYHPQWDRDSHEFDEELRKCVKSFQNAVINCNIQRLPDFLLERKWTDSNTISNDQRTSTVGDNKLHIEYEHGSLILPSLFATGSKNAHPPYRYKLALERCGQTKGLSDSTVRLEQAEALFTDGTATLCGWSSGKVDWVKFLQSLEKDVWIAASMEAKSPDEPQPERQKFIETFGEQSVVDRTNGDLVFEKTLLQ